METNLIIRVGFVGQELRQGNGQGSSLSYRVTRICWRLLCSGSFEGWSLAFRTVPTASHVIWASYTGGSLVGILSWQSGRHIFREVTDTRGPLLSLASDVTQHHFGFALQGEAVTVRSFKGGCRECRAGWEEGPGVIFKLEVARKELWSQRAALLFMSPRREQSETEVGVLGAQPGEPLKTSP